MSQQTPGELLVAKGGMLAPPALLDACALYGWSNPVLVAGLLQSLGELDGGAVGERLLEGLEEAGMASARALAEVHAKVRVVLLQRADEGGWKGGNTCLKEKIKNTRKSEKRKKFKQNKARNKGLSSVWLVRFFLFFLFRLRKNSSSARTSKASFKS